MRSLESNIPEWLCKSWCSERNCWDELIICLKEVLKCFGPEGVEGKDYESLYLQISIWFLHL